MSWPWEDGITIMGDIGNIGYMLGLHKDCRV